MRILALNGIFIVQKKINLTKYINSHIILFSFSSLIERKFKDKYIKIITDRLMENDTVTSLNLRCILKNIDVFVWIDILFEIDNNITSVGAGYIADLLRVNSTIRTLNLSGKILK